jgi:transcriptional regulator with XRE-family HTH domain
MTSRQLPNYLRTYRKRCGLSQSDLAYVVNLSGKSEWCQLERFHREPSYRTAKACGYAFGISTSKLFPGVDASTKKETARRMRKLRSRLAAKADATECVQRRITQKLDWLGQRLRELIPNFSVS